MAANISRLIFRWTIIQYQPNGKEIPGFKFSSKDLPLRARLLIYHHKVYMMVPVSMPSRKTFPGALCRANSDVRRNL